MLDSHVLDDDECRRLLVSGVFGRVAVTTPDGPHIVPVNYSVVEDSIVFRTTPYSILGTYAQNTQMTFEVDHVDYEYHTGWSVVATGRGEAISEAHQLGAISSQWRPHPWAAGSRSMYFGLRWTALSGRRLGPEIDWRRDLPTQRLTAKP